MKSIIVASLLLTTLVCSTSAQCIGRCDDHQSPYLNETSTETRMQYMMRRMGEDFQSYRIDVSVYPMFDVVGKAVPCEDGFATGYPCKNTDLLSALSHKTMGSRGGKGNDIWGWEDPESGREYAIVCQNDGTAFVDVTGKFHLHHSRKSVLVLISHFLFRSRQSHHQGPSPHKDLHFHLERRQGLQQPCVHCFRGHKSWCSSIRLDIATQGRNQSNLYRVRLLLCYRSLS